MITLTLDIPQTKAIDESELRLSLASKLYERGKLTLGQAAKVAGLSKRAFIEMLGLYGVSLFSSSVEDLDNDIKNA